MSIWKIAKDKVVLDRQYDQELHAKAFREVDSGVRRDGLWVKAMLQGHGDESKVKIAYLRLLVECFRDEDYLKKRIAEEQKLSDEADEKSSSARKARQHTAASAQESQQRYATSELSKLISNIKSGNTTYENYERLLKLAGGTISVKGLLFVSYLISFKGQKYEVQNFDDLAPFYIKHILPSFESS